ncbi:single-stranded DNA-binding protein [Mammaliicoccus sciuri]|uniref:single-stranded DNA-binding protein n=1 Tax=Mammaliicoccus sciuri TaxID=1296 RepID=UPI002DB97FC3|nr:single-stranded DNA-binding protein [Mammaliicoccus sciuri]MEB5649031.1 single-stranded DNA-binding protein [Mammaliicoccus sciuri]
MNTAILIGNITNDLEVRPAGQSNVLKFGLGVRGNFKKDETNFIQVEAWGKNAENIAKYFEKGSKILIQGELKQNRFEDKDGNKREKVYVNVDKFEFLDSKGSNQGQPKQQANDPFANTGADVSNSDLPF